MTELRGQSFGGVQRWGSAAGYAIIAAIGAAFIWVISIQDDPSVLVPVAWYTTFASLATLALGITRGLTRRLPSSRLGTIAGESATILRVWPWHWRWDVAIDAGLVLLSAVYMVMALGSDEARPIAPIALLIPLIWFGGKTILVLTGRRRLHALSLTETYVFMDSVNGRERIRRDQVVDARVEEGYVFVEFSGAVERHTGPRPWRRKEPPNPKYLGFNPEMMGPEPEQIVSWLRHELRLDLDQPAPHTDNASSTWRPFLPWRKTP